jgi:CHAT domain-containing protein
MIGRISIALVVVAACAAPAALAQAPARVYAGEPAATTRDGRHCALHPEVRGTLALIVDDTLRETTPPARALLQDPSGQLMLIEGALPGDATVRDPTEAADSRIAALGTITATPVTNGWHIRFRYRFEGIECSVAGEADLVALAPSAALEAATRGIRLLGAALDIREGDRLRSAGDSAAARTVVDRALATRREILGETNRYTVIALGKQGSLQWDMGEHAAAAQSQQHAYDITVSTLAPEHPDAFGYLQTTALAHWDLGELERAEGELRIALQGRRKVLDPDDEELLSTMFNMATLQGELGNLGEAQAGLEELYPIYLRMLGPDHATTLLLLNNLGAVYRQVGRYDDEYRVLTLACERYEKSLGDRHPATLRCLNNLAASLGHMGRKEEALVTARRAYDGRAATIGPTHPETLFSMGMYSQGLVEVGRVDEGLEMQRRLVAIRLETRGADHPETLSTYTVLSRTQALSGDNAGALASIRVAFEGFDAVRPRSPEALLSLARMAALEADMGDTTIAIRHHELLVTRIEERRRVETLSAESQRAAFSFWAGSYKRLTFLYAERGATDAAFRQLELSKARGLLETLAYRRAEAASGLTAAEQAALRRLERRIEAQDEAVARLRDKPDEQIKAEAERSAAARELADVHATLRARYPKYAQLTVPPIVDAGAARKLLRADAAFVSYALRGDDVLAFVVDRRGSARAYNLGPIPGLAQSVQALRTLLAPRGSATEPVWRLADGRFVTGLARPAADATRVSDSGEIARALGARLIDPIAPSLAGKSRLIVSPDGSLALLPFEALITRNGRVLDRYRVSYTQSLSVLALIHERARGMQGAGSQRALFAMGAAHYERRESPGAPAVEGADASIGTAKNVLQDATGGSAQRAYDRLGLAWHDLPGAAREIATVSRIFAAPSSDVLTGDQATETSLRALDASGALSRYRYLLFAAHGYLSTEAPALSAVVLGVDPSDPSSDGYVTVAEWVGYRLASELIVLSACETGVGREVQGEGIMGLPFALFVAGNRNALLTLWPVNDASTAELMRKFFVHVRTGMPHADALAEAKRALAKDPRYAAPAHWAGFVLYGD